MRASAKATDATGTKATGATGTTGTSRATGAPASVGRFGVGFAAVRALSDEILIASITGSVQFSAERSRALLAEQAAQRANHDSAERSIHAALLQALARPLADLPILRLPFPADLPTPQTLPPGYDTVVVARLRGPGEEELVRRLLHEVDDALLLALPALAEVTVDIEGEEPRTLRGVGERWLTVHVAGHHDPADLADRPHEERARTGWHVTWAIPRDDAAPELRAQVREPHVVHAPTPTDEPCTMPALLVATFPLEPSRRHVAPGPATDTLVRHAGETYAALAEQVAHAGGDPLRLVPTGLPAGRLDDAVRSAALDALVRWPLLAPVSPTQAADEPLIPPRAAQVIGGAVGHDPTALAALAPGVPGVVVAPRGPDTYARLRALGVEPRDLADVVDGMPTTLDVDQWRAIYDALAAHADEPGVTDALGGLPVPLADGRTVRGPRGLVAATTALLSAPGAEHPLPDLAALAPWGLRVMDPRAAHPLLTRLGATEADAAHLLGHPSVRAAILAAARDEAFPEQVTALSDAVLGLAGAATAAGADPAGVLREHPWLASLPLVDADGEPAPARELTVPGSWADEVLDGLRPAHPDLLARHGPAALRAVGVREGLTVVRVSDVVTDDVVGPGQGDAPESALDGWPEYLAELAEVLGPGEYVGDVTAVADLDAVADDAWPEVIRRLAENPEARSALLTPVRAAGRRAPSYTAWWLRDLLGGPFHPPGTVVPLLPPPPAELGGPDDAARLGPEVLAALGAVTDLEELDLSGWGQYLDSLPEIGTPVPLEAASALWAGLAAALGRPGAGRLPTSPERLPVLRPPSADEAGGPSAVVAALDDVVVAADPMWAQVTDVLPAPRSAADALAAALDVDLADDGDPPEVTTTSPVEARTPPEVLALLPGAAPTHVECERLVVDGVEVEWWVTGRRVYATTTAGLARGLSQEAGRWAARAVVEAVLVDPARASGLVLERVWDAG